MTYLLQAFATGDPEAGVWSAGPAMGLVKKVDSCENVIKEMMFEARERLSFVSKL